MRRRSAKTTVILLSLPITYIITTFPIFFIIFNNFTALIFDHYHQGEDGSANSSIDAHHTSIVHKIKENDVEFQIAKLIMYVNNSINIVIYVWLGKNLRADFFETLPNCLTRKRAT